MAILQISRITNRKGLTEDLPAPLAGAELGWATDSRRLFIGNGTVAEGAPVVGNTEILTEFSDLLSFANQYTYNGVSATGYTVQTGPTVATPVSQSIQARLDSIVIATDFGIVGDGVTDCTAAINRAMYQLYCIDNNPAVRRGLFFPAGAYLITGTLYIPTYATLIGEGNEGTTISMVTQTWLETVAWQADTIVVREGVYYLSSQAVPPNTSIGDTTYWTEVPAPAQVWQTVDSQFNAGTSIGLGSAVAPTGITITGIQFTTDNPEMQGALLEDASHVVLDSVSILGPLTEQNITDIVTDSIVVAPDINAGYEYAIVTLGDTDFTEIGASENVIGTRFTATGPGTGTGTAEIMYPTTTAIAWASTPALVCSNINITNCKFGGFWTGTKTDQQIKGIVISQSRFDTLYQGIYLGGDAPVDGGASGVRMVQNTFDNIYLQGISLENVEMNVSAYNTFYDVGNEFNGVDYPQSSIIDFDADNNVSIGDMFQRTADIAETSGLARINLHRRANIGMDGAYALDLGTYHRRSGLEATLVDGSDSAALFTVDSADTRAFAVDYTIVRDTAVETGKYTVVAGTDGEGTGLNSTYTAQLQNSATNVFFSVSESGGVVSLLYTVIPGGTDALLSYSVTKLA